MTKETTRPHPESGVSRRWVVGVDGSETSRHAALWAAANAHTRTNELHLTSTWSLPATTVMSPMTSITTSSVCDALEDAARSTLDELSTSLSPSLKIPVTTSVAHGGAAAVLIDAGRDAELLVVGSLGRGGFARLVLGSTSTQCATHATSPVAVIPSTAVAGEARKILVAFDGSENSMAALDWALGFAEPESTIDVVSVWDTTPVAVGTDQFFFPEASDLARERFEHLAGEGAGRREHDGVEVRNEFVEGHPRNELAERSESCDLLVMGARGHGAISAAVLGSVSTWLLHHVRRPMVVVPHV